MRRFDVFNGDADGICALRQLRLARPAAAQLVTGLKHEVAILDRVDAQAGDEVTVLDLSLDRNRAALEALLARGVSVSYFDHHDPGIVPRHPGLRAAIDAGGGACTSELVDQHLGGRFRPWAVVGAFGDNFLDAAVRLARGLGLTAAQLERLRALGECLNYNAYGATVADVLVPPATLYGIAARHADPFALAEEEPAIAQLARARHEDLARALDVPALRSTPSIEIHRLPDASWARRVMGEFANARARGDASRAHAVLVPRPGGGCTVSVRAPAGWALSAAQFCRRFPTGGGRVTAAGIERLEEARVEEFIAAFERAYR